MSSQALGLAKQCSCAFKRTAYLGFAFFLLHKFPAGYFFPYQHYRWACFLTRIESIFFKFIFAEKSFPCLCSRPAGTLQMIRLRSIVSFSCIWAITLTLLLACGRQEDAGYKPEFAAKHNEQVKEYVVGVHPLHNPKRLMEIYGELIEYANMQIPDARFRLEASRNYEEFDKKLYAGYYDLAMPNPYQTVRAFKNGYRVFAKMGDDAEFCGIILVRKDSNIREVADLKGKVVAYPARSALAATMLPQYFLHTHGIDVNFDIENRYVGSQESSILNVLRGHVAAGATWPLPWQRFRVENPEMANQLEVKWQTAPLLNNSWVARRDVPRTIVDKFKMQLLGLDETPEGRQILAKLPISKFETATNETYLPVIRFLEIFSSDVRELEW